MDQMLEDYIEMALTAESVVTNDTVKLIAKITAQVQPDEPPDALPARIREMLGKVTDADWKFSNMVRAEDATGFERVTLTASARVPERENFNLEGRCKAVSSLGLKITSIEADISIPSSMIEQALKNLRRKLAEMAVEEAAALSKAMPGNDGYRVSRIAYTTANSYANQPHRMMKSLSVSATANYAGGGDDDDDGALGNSQRVGLSANITLARTVPLHASYM